MPSNERYEILDQIATGDYAAVYRARDRELQREVAVKQIHAQFLADRQQLDRYWHEAQLLAALHHPNILTIYDIVRPKGWLILELMRGSLAENVKKAPLDLGALRMAMLHSLHALQFLHANGIVHGDVKPSNLLLDRQKLVKLGDFGLARRASDESGSLLKGTTKYMAPEVVSDQCGAVGPAADLYSLGFSAYELMCGPQFESLFPGLYSYGRDTQIAWMMWHATVDRKLPAIPEVLEGVPDDLALVIGKLVRKDQQQRYQSAQEVINDLTTTPIELRPPEQAEQDEEKIDEKAGRRRRLLIGGGIALVCCLLLAIFLLPGKEPVVETPPEPVPIEGVVAEVLLDERKLIVRLAENDKPEELDILSQHHVYVNDKQQLPRNLKSGDFVTIRYFFDDAGRRLMEIRANRPQKNTGVIVDVKAPAGRMEFTTIVDGDPVSHTVTVGRRAKITLNDSDSIDSRPLTLADLHQDDRVTVSHVEQEGRRRAMEIHALRVVSVEGTIYALASELGGDRGAISLALGDAEDPAIETHPLAPDCEVMLNDSLVQWTDLQPGDRVSVKRDVEIVRIDAQRMLTLSGKVVTVPRGAQLLVVVPDGEERAVNIDVDDLCETITLASEPARLAQLRPGDEVRIEHSSLDVGADRPKALSIAAVRPPDLTKRAILIAVGNYDDVTLASPGATAADAQLLRDALVRRYQVADEHAQLLSDPGRIVIERTLDEAVSLLGEEDSLLVFFAGHAYTDEEGRVYLAPSDFTLDRIAASGILLKDLVDKMEECQAGEKLLLLDCCRADAGGDLVARQPSTAEMLHSLDHASGRTYLRTVAAVASCSAGQRGVHWEQEEHGLFGYYLARAYAGEADQNANLRIDPSELEAFLTRQMAATAETIASQATPEVFYPDATPPRLGAEARKAIGDLLLHIHDSRLSVDSLRGQYVTARGLAAGEPDADLVWALLLLKARKLTEAGTLLEGVKNAAPRSVLPRELLVWRHFNGKQFDEGLEEMTELFSTVVKPARPGEVYPPSAKRLFTSAGILRQYAAVIGKEVGDVAAGLDEAVAKHPAAAGKVYQDGRTEVSTKIAAFDLEIQQGGDYNVEQSRRRLTTYIEFPYITVAEEIRTGLDSSLPAIRP